MIPTKVKNPIPVWSPDIGRQQRREKRQAFLLQNGAFRGGGSRAATERPAPHGRLACPRSVTSYRYKRFSRSTPLARSTPLVFVAGPVYQYQNVQLSTS